MRRARFFTVAALVALAGCGGGGSNGKPIPRDQADRMLALIQTADDQAQNGTCGGASAKVREAQSVASTLPASVDKDVRQGITDGLARLSDLVASQCQRPSTPAQTQTTQTETTQSQTQPTQTETTSTETTPTSSNTTTTDTNTGTTTTDTTTTDTSTGNGGTPGAGILPPGDG